MTDVIKSTREIREKHVHCPVGEQAAHLVGLNLAKELFNYYARERQMIISKEELALLKHDINKRENIECESVEANTHDKYTEREVLEMLFTGTRTYNDISVEAREMFRRLVNLLKDMLAQSTLRETDASIVIEIVRELEGREFPLQRHCHQCHLQCFLYESDNKMTVFCDVTCQTLFFFYHT